MWQVRKDWKCLQASVWKLRQWRAIVSWSSESQRPIWVIFTRSQFMLPAQGRKQILGTGYQLLPPHHVRAHWTNLGAENCLLGWSDHMTNQCQKGNSVSQLQSPSHSPLLDPLCWCSTDGCGNSETSDSNDPYQSEYEYLDSIHYDKRKLLSLRAREAKERREERIAQRPTPFVRKCTNGGVGFQTPDCCTLVRCPCWKSSKKR